MIYMININTEIFLRSVKDLNKLKLLVEVNNLDRPNFSAIARELGVDRRTVKKYYDGDIKKVRKSKKSKIDDFYDIISSLLSAETDQIFLDNMLASAILDRLVHHSTIVNILGNSYRTATALSKISDKNN